MKVYGVTTTPQTSWGARGRQVRCIVAAPSWAAAGRAFRAAGINYSDHALRMYGAITGNERELAAATEPGVVLWAEETGDRTFHVAQAVSRA